MAIYLVNFFLIAIYTLIYYSQPKEKRNKKTLSFFIILSTLQLILLQSVKDINLGSDMPFYWKYYNLQLNYNFSELSFSRFELLFKILTKLVTNITNSKSIYLFVISCLSTAPIGYITYKYSKSPFLSILLYLSFGFYAFNFSGLRQAVAFGLIFFSYKFIMEKKLYKYLITVICAILFHKSAFIFLPAYFFYNIKLNKIKFLILFLVDISFFIFKVPIYSFISNIFYEEYGVVISNSYLWMVMCFAIFMFSLIFYKKVLEKNTSATILYVLVAIGTSIMIFAPVANNILRVANYYYMFVILLVPEVISVLKENKNQILMMFIVIFCCFVLYYYSLSIDLYNIVPYIYGGLK